MSFVNVQEKLISQPRDRKQPLPPQDFYKLQALLSATSSTTKTKRICSNIPRYRPVQQSQVKGLARVTRAQKKYSKQAEE